jgi:phage/plasmid primase-like uncharacterized protein
MLPAADLAARWKLHRSRNGWRGDCPACGYAGGLVLDQREGRPLAWCASCQDSKALGAMMRDGCSLPSRTLSPAGGDAEALARRKQARALEIWERATPISGTSAATYLEARGLPALACSRDLRFSAVCRHPENGSHPALIALVRDQNGKPLAIHRTFLRADGSGKADAEPQKASLGPIWGGAIRLYPIASEIVIGEGVESSASAGLLIGLPAWAAISCGNLAKGLALPSEVRAVVIAADPDPPGEAAAQQAARRWQAEGRTVRIIRPIRDGADFNDLLREAARHG